MSADDVEIRSGGAVAVDTASLGTMALQASLIATTLDDAASRVRRALALLGADGIAWSLGHRLVRRAESGADEARTIARQLREAAAVYELVELRIRRAAAASAGDASALAVLDTRMAALARVHPGAPAGAVRVEREWTDGWDDELLRQVAEGALFLGPFAAPAARVGAGLVVGAIGRAGLGRIPPGARLQGSVPPPPMTATARGTMAAPASLSDLAARIPPSPDRVRVERYPMPDGTRRFAVYVAGTQGWAGDEPWDMTSNARLYTGARSDSYAAVESALTQAGAHPGDVVYAAGHSQGAMIAGRLAMEGGYDTRLLATFGSPVEADVGSETLSVQVRHRDDPVAVLVGAGDAAPVGADGGFIAQRTVDPQGRPGDLALGPHQLTAYEETARAVDASADPRAGVLRARLAELSGVQADVTTWAPVSGRADGDAG